MSISSVIFLNQPKLSGHSVNQDQDERRLALVPKIDSWLSNHQLFQNKKVSVSFFQAGASGLTSLLDAEDKKFVLKVLLRPDGPQGEPQFLKAWEAAGVPVPHVYEFGMLEDHPYILMSYVDAQSLEHSSETELLEKNVFVKMGETLRQIHQTKAKGFGRMKEDGIGEYETFTSWLLEFPQTINQLSYMQKHDLLPEEAFGSVDNAKKILLEHIGENTDTTYCHWDFAPGNILNTDPLTVFDPVPTYNHPYLDIARSIVQTIGAGFARPEVSEQFLKGYFSDTSLDQKFLQAAVLFISHTKMPHWHKTDETKILENLKTYLAEHKHLME
jgi:fructosamine-3-kinase